jgi:hypothetical protein
MSTHIDLWGRDFIAGFCFLNALASDGDGKSAYID